jgi:hypothetical protein
VLIDCQAARGATETYTADKEKCEATLVTGRRIPFGCETSELPHFLDNQLTDGGEDVSLADWSPFAPGRFLALIAVRGRINPRVIVRLKG